MMPLVSTMFRTATLPARSFTATTARKGLFSQNNPTDVITLFHKSSLPASVRVRTMLKQAAAQASQTATEDQASDHSHQDKIHRRQSFELEITEADPTPDQVRSILEYIGAGKAGTLVKGASSESDALKILKQSADAFQRPVVVDWTQGKAIVGEQEQEILKMVQELPK
jgi:arsenate reductase-like glutaredoxin family protein